MSVIYVTAGYLSKCCYQCVSQLLRRYFEHSCDQVTFRMPFSKKNYHNRDGSVIQLSFLSFVPNRNNNNKTCGIPCYFHTIQGSDLLKTRESYFSFIWAMDFSIIFPSLGETRVSTVNSDLTNFVDVKR